MAYRRSEVEARSELKAVRREVVFVAGFDRHELVSIGRHDREIWRDPDGHAGFGQGKKAELFVIVVERQRIL